jgi:hypothetical protein
MNFWKLLFGEPEPSSRPSNEDLRIAVHTIPDGTVKIIHELVEARVREVERRYRWGLVGILAAIIIVFFGTYKAVKEEVAKQLSTNEVKDQSEEIKAWHRESTTFMQSIERTSIAIQNQEKAIAGRLVELQKQDNVVTYDKMGRLVLQPKDGLITVKKASKFVTYDVESGEVTKWDKDPAE